MAKANPQLLRGIDEVPGHWRSLAMQRGSPRDGNRDDHKSGEDCLLHVAGRPFMKKVRCVDGNHCKALKSSHTEGSKCGHR